MNQGSSTADSRVDDLVVQLLAAALLVCFAVQSIHGLLRESATFDEQVYAFAGYSYLKSGEYRMKSDAPPLVPLVGGMMLRGLEYFTRPLVMPDVNGHAENATDYSLAKDFFCNDNNRGLLMLRLVRFPMVIPAMLLGICVFAWGRAMLGPVGGLTALFLYCFDPNMIAHSRLVAADLPLSAFLLMAHYYLYRYLRRDDVLNLLLMSLAVALSICVKFNGPLVLPSLGAAATAVYFLTPKGDSLRFNFQRKAVIGTLSALGMTLMLMAILYQSPFGVVRYVNGMRTLYSNVTPGYNYYLFGRFSPKPWPYYYLAAMAVKTPIATLFLFAVSLWPWHWRRHSSQRIAYIFLMVPIALVEIVCAGDKANFGLRRIVAVYPFIFLMIGRLAAMWPEFRAKALRPLGRATPAIPIIFAAAYVVGAVAIHPYQLSFFNRLIGGPRQGYKYLADSNIDWGQDLPALAEYLKRRNISEVALFYFGMDDPKLYGIRARNFQQAEWINPRKTIYAVSVQNLIYNRHIAQATGAARMDWLSRFQPTDLVGYSIYIYDWRQSDPPGPETPK